MEKRDIYVTMVLLTILIVLSIATGDQSTKMKGDSANGVKETRLSKK